MPGTMRFGFRMLFLSALLIPALALFAACGGGGDGDGDDDGDDGGNGGGPASFDVTMGDSTSGGAATNFFEPNEFTVATGQQVTFNLTNEGTAIHNMRVDGGDNAYNTDDDTVSDPDLFAAGDSGTLVWTAPDDPGEIIFQCDFHPADMTGTITVE